jgi:hypothetical protein
VRKLTPEEITATVSKIRSRYDDYVWRYFKSKAVKNAFEERYIYALRTGLDISSFLIAEIGAVEELIHREESRLQGPVSRGNGDAKQQPPRQSATDRILEAQRQRIHGYPDALFHPDANEELRRMLGALSTFLAERWDGLMRVLRNTSYSHRSGTMANLEHELRYLGWVGSDGIPSGLGHYVALLKAFPRDYGNLEREQKNYLLAASFFLHDLEDILRHVLEAYPQLGEESVSDVAGARDFVRDLIDSFRLRDLKRKK